MPFCQYSLKVSSDNSEKVINQIAVEQFSAHQAHQLTAGMWNIDAALNDVRAIDDEEHNLVKFFCRYGTDIQKTDSKIADFAGRHSELCELVVVGN